jgi:hypothetical protein
MALRIPPTIEEMSAYLIALRTKRRQIIAERKEALGFSRRQTLTAKEQKDIFAKTAERCHLCGGDATHGKLVADHVLAHSTGGEHKIDNYLASHGLCNRYRWDYGPEEFQLILQLGVWARGQMLNATSTDETIFERFSRRENAKVKRRRKS